MGEGMELTTKRMREIADLDSRAGAPVGCALCAAADRIDAAVGALEDLVIAIGMGWDLDGFLENAKGILNAELKQ